jgi:hypothetical protein
LAVENKVSTKMIALLLRFNADPHIEDKNGKDCCDKVREMNIYKEIEVFWKKDCYKSPRLRIR